MQNDIQAIPDKKSLRPETAIITNGRGYFSSKMKFKKIIIFLLYFDNNILR